MTFLLQQVSKYEGQAQCEFDLCQAMEKADEYWRWKGQPIHIMYDRLEWMFDVDKDICPVGTIEFVFKYIDKIYGENAHLKIKPINVPEWAEIFSIGNTVFNIKNATDATKMLKNRVIDSGNRMFMKSAIEFKSPMNGFIDSVDQIRDNVQLVPEGNILSEWRMFVHKGECIDIRNYSGDPFCFPDNITLNKIKVANNSVVEGTIDICVTDDHTVHVIECHDFFSCGLYGFSDYNALPVMLWRTWCKIKQILEK